MKNYYLLFFLFIPLQSMQAQVMPEQRVAKAIYVEALGSGIGLSLNYDTRFKPGLTGLGLRVGVGGISGSGDQSRVTLISLPVLVNYVIGNSRASFESGLGLMASYVTAAGKDAVTGDYATAQGAGISVAGNFGLRLQPKQNGVHFRLYWSPFITDHGLQPQWLGLSLGYGFR
jgi:hypothetical protein